MKNAIIFVIAATSLVVSIKNHVDTARNEKQTKEILACIKKMQSTDDHLLNCVENQTESINIHTRIIKSLVGGE